MLYYMTAADPGIFNLAVGETIARSVVEFPERVAVTGPDGSTQTVAEAVERREFGRYVLPLSNFPLDRAGPTLLEVDSSVSGKSLREVYAANVDPLEGDLERADANLLAALFPGVKLSVVDSAVTGGERADGAANGEFWKQILWALLALTALELFLSWKFGDYS